MRCVIATQVIFLLSLKCPIVPYVVITEKIFDKLLACEDCMEIFEQVKKMTSNYRVWNGITDFIEQCSDIISDKMAAAKEVEFP